MMKHILITLPLLLGATNLSAQSSWRTSSSMDEQYKAEVRRELQLDYSMPDYSTHKIDAKVIGSRLATILFKLNENYRQRINMDFLNIVLTNQIEGLSYAQIKKMKLDEVTKIGNTIMITYKTDLQPNNLGLKNAPLTFRFVDSVSDDKSTNDIFCMVCRYINE